MLLPRYNDKKTWYHGFVSNKNTTNSTFSVKYDDQEVEENIPPYSTRIELSVFEEFDENQPIQALFEARKTNLKHNWFQGKITKKYISSKYGKNHYFYNIMYDDKDEEKDIHGDLIRKIS